MKDGRQQNKTLYLHGASPGLVRIYLRQHRKRTALEIGLSVIFKEKYLQMQLIEPEGRIRRILRPLAYQMNIIFNNLE